MQYRGGGGMNNINTIQLENMFKKASYKAVEKTTEDIEVIEENKSRSYIVSYSNATVGESGFLRVQLLNNDTILKDNLLLIARNNEGQMTELTADDEPNKIRLIGRNITINGLSIKANTGSYTQPKIDQSVVVNVVKESVITAEVMMANNAWLYNMSVEELTTNFWDISPLNPSNTGMSGTFNRDYIKVKEKQLSFIQEQRSYDSFEDYVLTYPNGTEATLFWSAIEPHQDAYKFFTTTNPNEIYKDLTEEEIERYKVKVFKRIGEPLVKLAIEFNEEGEPRITFGKTSDPTFGPLEMYKTAVDAKREWYRFQEAINPENSIAWRMFNDKAKTDLASESTLTLDGFSITNKQASGISRLLSNQYSLVLSKIMNDIESGVVVRNNNVEIMANSGSANKTIVKVDGNGLGINCYTPDIAGRQVRNISAGKTLPAVSSNLNDGDIFLII